MKFKIWVLTAALLAIVVAKIVGQSRSAPTRVAGPIASVPVAAAPAMQPDSTGGPPSLEHRKVHSAIKDGEVYDVAIKELGNFAYDPSHGGVIPADVRALNGKTIRTHGYMIPLEQSRDVTHFSLVPSLLSCCYGLPPQIQHTINVTVVKDKAIEYYPDEIIVEGKLTVHESTQDGYVVRIFDLEATSVRTGK